MTQEERTKHANELLSQGALWYAWGQLDAGLYPTLDTEDGAEFQKLYELFIEQYSDERAYTRPNVIRSWKRFAALKVANQFLSSDRPIAPITQDDIYVGWTDKVLKP